HRDDVDAMLEHRDVVGDRGRVAFGSARGVADAVRREAEQRVGVARRDHADGPEPYELAGVAAVLPLAVHPYTCELEVRPAMHGADCERADPAGGPHNDLQWIGCQGART